MEFDENKMNVEKNIGDNDVTPKIERKDENVENIEGVEDINLNSDLVREENNSNNLEDINKATIDSAIIPESEIEETKFEGLELRSRMLAEESTSLNALEVYTAFKKVNYLDIPNVHRKL